MNKFFKTIINAVLTTAIAFAGFYGRFNLLILLAIAQAVFNEYGKK